MQTIRVIRGDLNLSRFAGVSRACHAEVRAEGNVTLEVSEASRRAACEILERSEGSINNSGHSR